MGAGREKSEVRSRCTWNRLSCEKKKKKKNATATEIATPSFGEEAAERAELLRRDVIPPPEGAVGVL